MAGESTENDPRWSEYNYPPLLKLFHYSISDLRDPMKSIARKLNAGAIVVLIIQPLQLLSTCLQLAAKCEVVRKRNLIYSILNCFLWPTLAFFIFHRGYVAICQGPLHTVSLMLFYGSSLCALIIWSYQAIAGGASNGIIKMVKLKSCTTSKQGLIRFITALCCLELFLWSLAIFLLIYNALKVKSIYGKHYPVFVKETEIQRIERKEEKDEGDNRA